jgi:hypothetical protein
MNFDLGNVGIAWQLESIEHGGDSELVGFGEYPTSLGVTERLLFHPRPSFRIP